MSFRKRILIPLIAILVIGSAGVMPNMSVSADEKLTPDQRKEIQDLIRQTIRENPEMLIEALKGLEEKQKQAQAGQILDTIKVERTNLRNDPLALVLGNPKGDVTIVEFFDYRCGYCKQAYPNVKSLIEADSGIKVIMKEFPILGPESILATQAALASREQGKYRQLHEAMMATRNRLDEATILQIAAEAGLDIKKLKTDMQHPKIQQQIQANYALAEKLGIEGTPAFIIGDQLVPGAIPLERMKKLVVQARSACMTC